ncbi:Glutamyl-tRNA synthetase [hydrothermal vent metagenome]|uniref:glutamate--tRNA ligase n=1 Tax=hydrothermal vent metagenome TaxID=652676 RepID=A0A3B0TN21_9ZZZZ
MTKSTITRFAPSPTGFLHIGGARTALFNWAYAKKTGGKMLLRIEDTDRARSTTKATKALLDGLSWLGLDWDGEPISQYERASRHAEIARQLVAQGKAYQCFCSRDELTKMREEARAAGRTPKYDGRWRERDASEAPQGVSPVIRIKTPKSGEIIINDIVQGEVRFKCENLDDFIILRSDGSPTYMHAVVVDDHDMEVTHIIRGDDHLTNAARQIVIYNALGWQVPQMAHIPLIHGPDGAKLSKRHGALGVAEYRKMGYLPEAMRNYLARLGWSHGDDEFFSTEQLVEWFSLEALNKGAARFDFVKLANLNGQHIRQAKPEYLFQTMLDLADEVERTNDFDGLLANRNTVLAALPDLQPRAKTVLELIDLAQFIYATRPLEIEEKAKKHLSDETRATISELAALLAVLPEWSLDALNETVRKFAEEKEIKLGKVAQPLRVALTGRTVSPGVFEVMVLLGRDETLARLSDQK